MKLLRFVMFLTIVTLTCIFLYTLQIVPIANAIENSCQKALRIHKEITPGMQKLIWASNLPPGLERAKEMTDVVMSGVAEKRFYDEFCPALIERGGLPGYPMSTTDVIIDICKKGIQK